MRFLFRTLTGLFLSALTVSILVLAGAEIISVMRDAGDNDRRMPQARERIFAANVATLTSETITPEIHTFGTVLSSRSVEVRASVGGTLVEMSPQFRNGGHVAAGDLVFQIDPAKPQSDLALAQNQLVEAKAELNAARDAVILAQNEEAIALTQRRLREQALAREQSLRAQDLGTDATVENAEQSLASADQALLNQQQALALVDTRIWRAEAAVERSEISLAEAQRILAETRVVALFDGVFGEVSGVLGRLVSTNEKLGVLIDPTAMELEFRLSNSQFARIIDDRGEILQNRISATFARDDLPLEIEATIVRIGAEVGEGQTGRLLYAQLDSAAALLLLPGDFLTIRIEEQPLERVAKVPATAVNADGSMLVLGEDDRLDEISVQVLRRQGDDLIVGGVPFGREYITERSVQIGSGIQVRPLRSGAVEAPIEPEVFVLDDARRANLIAFIEGNTRMPADAKGRLLEQLNKPDVPRDVVERLESRMGN